MTSSPSAEIRICDGRGPDPIGSDCELQVICSPSTPKSYLCFTLDDGNEIKRREAPAFLLLLAVRLTNSAADQRASVPNWGIKNYYF